MPTEPVDPPDPPEPGAPEGTPGASGRSVVALELPSQVRAAAIVVLLQAAGLLGAVVALVVGIARGAAESAGRAWADAGVALIAALALLLAARALSYLRPAVRTPLLVIEVLTLPVGYSMLESGQWRYGGPVLIGGLVVTALLLTRPARSALNRP